jgi:YegS/Rv2252/BmrU family lipid kinase
MSDLDRSRPVHLIVNPKSGYGGSKHLLGDLRQAVRARGLELVEYVTKAPWDATRYAGSITDQASAVLVYGGDGTMSEVANGLAGSSLPMLPCPAGTENLLAKEIAVPSDPAAIVDILLEGHVTPCDVARINDRFFLLILGVGFDGEVVHRVAGGRSGHISHLDYFWPIWRTFWEHEFPHMRITLDGQEVFNDRGLAFVGNISRYAMGLYICQDAQYNDRKLDMVIYPCHDQSMLVLHSALTLFHLHVGSGQAIYRQFSSATIESDSHVQTQVDGDPGPAAPLEIEVLPDQVQLLVPEEGLCRRPEKSDDQ